MFVPTKFQNKFNDIFDNKNEMSLIVPQKECMTVKINDRVILVKIVPESSTLISNRDGYTFLVSVEFSPDNITDTELEILEYF